MKLPFTPAQFFAVFSAYNTAIWPFQLVLLGLAAVVVFALVRGTLSRTVLGILSLFWIWMASIYHLRFFLPINPAARLFALLFGIAAVAFAWASLRTRVIVRRPAGIRKLVGWCLAGYALIGYPLVASAAGQRYPALPTFGLPCPTTIFTLAALLLVSATTPRWLFAVPLLWSVIGTTAAAQLDVPEDYGLGVAGLLSLVLLLLPSQAAPVLPWGPASGHLETAAALTAVAGSARRSCGSRSATSRRTEKPSRSSARWPGEESTCA